MKNLSIKIKITIWYTLLMTLMAGLVLAFTLFISNSVLSQSSMTQLSQTVRANLPRISQNQGRLELGDEFEFYKNGVYTLVYSQQEALLAGQIPVSFTAQEPFQSGKLRLVDTGETDYYVLDFWYPFSWEEGVWVRGLLAAPEGRQAVQELLLLALITLPAFLLLAALGGYWIARRAFRPLDSITATAAAINEAKDLSGRIALPPGRDEFSRLASTFDQMFERLERSFEAEKQFTADASHELRTPVSVIKGACEYALKYEETPEERRETLEMIQRQAEKMSRLINQLLSMTRLEQGTEAVRLESTELSGLIRSFCREQLNDEEAKGLSLDLSPVTVLADPLLLTRLLQNLLDNAWKYGRPKGKVRILLEEKEREILLSVQDEGEGIPKEQQEKIWQRFYQVSPSRSGDSGTGLGLAMVRQIAGLHGGYMTVESEAGRGSCFTLHLPKK